MKVFSRFPDLLSIVGEITSKKLSELREQSEGILHTLV